MKEEFIIAFKWYFGGTRKEAERQYELRKLVNPENIGLIIDCYRLHCIEAFEED